MKDYLCVFLSACLVVSTSCSTETKNNHRPAPSAPATQKQIEQTEKKFEQQGNQQAQTNGGKTNQDYSKAKAYLDTAVSSLMANSDMRIKDYAGKDITLEEYKKNPTQGFVLFAEDEGYSVLKTSVNLEAFNTVSVVDVDKIDFTYEVFKMTGDMDEFEGKNLGDAAIEENMTVDTKNILANRAAIEDLFNRINNAQYAFHAGAFQQLTDFLFPSAYADDGKKKLLITAIVFTSISVLSYVFAFYPIGDISAAVAIVFWLLYAFNDDH